MAREKTHDAYIAGAAAFAVPILQKLQAAVRQACPDVEETIRWSTPHFDHHGILMGMAAFKHHVSVSFWRGREMSDPEDVLEVMGRTGVGVMRIERLADLPTQSVLVRYVEEAMRLNEAAASAPRKTAKKKAAKRSVRVPADLAAALKKSRKAATTFDGFSYTHRKEYVDWITEAKRDATREKRVAQAVAWMAEGKPRNWKYRKEWR